MSGNHTTFDRRVRVLNRKHDAMSTGYTTMLRKDGLIVVQPARARARFPFKFLFILVVGLILFKGFVLASVGPEGYDTRVAALAEGTTVEKAGAWVMQSEPATQFVAKQIAVILP